MTSDGAVMLKRFAKNLKHGFGVKRADPFARAGVPAKRQCVAAFPPLVFVTGLLHLPATREVQMPKISKTSTLQTVITTFEMTPGTCQDLLDALNDAYDSFIRHQPGFIAAGLHVNDAQTRIANYSQWRRREDFQAMLRSPEMRERNRAISALCKSFEPVMYEVAATFG